MENERSLRRVKSASSSEAFVDAPAFIEQKIERDPVEHTRKWKEVEAALKKLAVGRGAEDIAVALATFKRDNPADDQKMLTIETILTHRLQELGNVKEGPPRDRAWVTTFEYTSSIYALLKALREYCEDDFSKKWLEEAFNHLADECFATAHTDWNTQQLWGLSNDSHLLDIAKEIHEKVPIDRYDERTQEVIAFLADQLNRRIDRGYYSLKDVNERAKRRYSLIEDLSKKHDMRLLSEKEVWTRDLTGAIQKAELLLEKAQKEDLDQGHQVRLLPELKKAVSDALELLAETRQKFRTFSPPAGYDSSQEIRDTLGGMLADILKHDINIDYEGKLATVKYHVDAKNTTNVLMRIHELITFIKKNRENVDVQKTIDLLQFIEADAQKRIKTDFEAMQNDLKNAGGYGEDIATREKLRQEISKSIGAISSGENPSN